MGLTGPKPIVGSLLLVATVLAGVMLHASPSLAQITLDGTIRRDAPSGPLTGPNFIIPAEAGATQGNNLFHSFGQFNLQKNEKATFNGAGSIENIISRVTGGTPSFINGTIDSKTNMPRANFFLLNPSGVLFGADASLNIGGAFHVTTAGCIRAAGENCLNPTPGTKLKFFADQSSTSVLTADTPAAFGFLGPSPVRISVEGSHLTVNAGKTLSVVGGEAPFPLDTETGLKIAPPPMQPAITPVLSASGGQVQIVSVASPGEVTLTDLNVASFIRLGQIDLSGKAVIDASGPAGGTVLIRGGRLVMDDSSILANTTGSLVGAVRAIDVRLTGAMELENGAKIGADTSFVPPNLGQGGLGGEIVAEVGALSLKGGSQISRTSRSSNPGQTGGVKVTATDSVTISGKSISGNSSGLFTNTFRGETLGGVSVYASSLEMSGGGTISVLSQLTGASGDISVTGPPGRALRELTLTDGATISSSVVGNAPPGKVTVTADSVLLSGRDPGGVTGILSDGRLDAPAGDISLNVRSLTVKNGAVIDSGSRFSNDGGSVTVLATESVVISRGGRIRSQARSADVGEVRISPPPGGPAPTLTIDNALVTTSTSSRGRGGNINVEAGQILLTNGATISTTSSGTTPICGGRCGDAGNLTLASTGDFRVQDSIVTTQATTADGGNITLTAGSRSLLYLTDSRITTSVQSGQGKGGNITIDPQFVILDHSQVRADAFGGPGGNIDIVADVFLASDSIISASSALSTSGTINIQASVTDLSGSVAPLPAGLLQAATLLRASCAARVAAGKASSLVVTGREGLPLEPGGYLPSPWLAQELGDAGSSNSDGRPWETFPQVSRLALVPTCSR